MYGKAVDTIKKYSMIKPGDGIVVGLSGGADSCALTSVLARLAKTWGLKITAVHINHGIRGAEADSDEAFAAELCQRLGVDFLAFHFDVPAEAKKRGLGEEETGRLIRYEKFRETAKATGAASIAVAHNINDTAETLMMNLCRGAGLKGMSGISPMAGGIIRPLIFCTREEIEKYCRDEGIAYRTDSTNLQNDYTRNKIRNVLFPWLRENINPSADMNMAKTAAALREEDDFLEKLAEDVYKKVTVSTEDKKTVLDAVKLAEENTVIRKRVLRLALRNVRKDMRDVGRNHTEEMESLLFAGTGKSVDLPGDIRALRSYDTLEICSGQGDEKTGGFFYELEAGKKLYVPEMDRYVLLSEKWEKLPDNCVNVYTKKIDYDKIKAGIQLRTRKSGDTLSIRGGRKKLKDIFIDDKIPADKRGSYPVLASGDSVIAVGDRLGYEYYVGKETKRTLYIYIWEESKNDRES